MTATDGAKPQAPIAPPRFLDAEGRLVCPGCGCRDFRVANSIEVAGIVKRRYRACRNCGIRVRTKEVLDDA